MNVKLLEKVKKFLQRVPRRFDMTEGIIRADRLDSILDPPPCGTACCIAGAAYIIKNKIVGVLSGTDADWQDVRRDAITALNITSAQADRLFLLDSVHNNGMKRKAWPKKYEKAYLAAKTPEARVAVAVARIDRFISSNGRV